MRTTKTLSHCNCQLETYENGQFLLCRYAKEWLYHIEARTDQSIEYEQSLKLYERVQRKQKVSGDDERQIDVDVPRTFPDEPFFAAAQPMMEDDVVLDGG